MEVISREGIGTRITIALPCPKPVSRLWRPRSKAAVKNESLPARVSFHFYSAALNFWLPNDIFQVRKRGEGLKKVMIVEDHKKIRDELCVFLSQNGYACYAPESFEDILGEVFKTSPSLSCWISTFPCSTASTFAAS
jgi:hypothetical protein